MRKKQKLNALNFNKIEENINKFCIAPAAMRILRLYSIFMSVVVFHRL